MTVYSVTQITEAIVNLFQEEFSGISVEGEISGWKVAASGHVYFCLKDENAVLKAVMWKSRRERIKITPADGQLVRVNGSITVYPPRGEYQIDVLTLTQAGLGLLQKRFEELKRRLEEEGLFDPLRKRRPERPIRKAVVITSPSGAALHDFLKTLGNQGTCLHIIILPARVQGLEAPPEIVAALAKAPAFEPDLVILTRGGGSLEDLWAFNEEAVARAIAACPIPVLSAVGHEIDFTIADLAADLRASTPTAAAAYLASECASLREETQTLTQRLVLAMEGHIVATRSELRGFLGQLMARSPLVFLPYHRQCVDDLTGRSERALRRNLADYYSKLERQSRCIQSEFRMDMVRWRGKVQAQAERLCVLDPSATLRRGYALCEGGENSKLIRSIDEVQIGKMIRVRLCDGSFSSVPTETIKLQSPV